MRLTAHPGAKVLISAIKIPHGLTWRPENLSLPQVGELLEIENQFDDPKDRLRAKEESSAWQILINDQTYRAWEEDFEVISEEEFLVRKTMES